MENISRNRKSLLIIDKEQFGYTTDLYKWCEYLRDEYDITFLTADKGLKKVHLDGIKIFYVKFGRLPYVMRGLLFIATAVRMIARSKGAVMVEYFKGCSLLQRLFPGRKMIVDVRTLSIFPDSKVRADMDARMIKDCRKFQVVSVISSGVRESMGIDSAMLLPLGSDVISSVPKHYTDSLRLLYVGTFTNRRLDRMIRGVKMFVDDNPVVTVTLDVVGDGLAGELDRLRALSRDLGLDAVVKFHGYIPLTQVKPFFDKCNVGLSFVPMTSYYDNQPPTKTFEYIRSGLFCIATGTKANREIVTTENGIIVDDTPEGICQALSWFAANSQKIDEVRLRKSLADSAWENIAKNILKPILEKTNPTS
ncbi:MAG: glycosyltransferase [Staphylococcus sp.]|nr:glycosyltransferase [Staphylococcus sp.]